MNIQKFTLLVFSITCWLAPCYDKGPLFPLKQPDAWASPKKPKSPGSIFRASEPVHGSNTDEAGVTPPHMGWFTPEQQQLVPTVSACPLQCHLHTPGCVSSPLLLQHPALNPKWHPRACPSQREAPRSCGKQVVLRGRKPQSTLPSNTGQIPVSRPVRWTQCLGSTGEEKEDLRTSP